MTDSATLSKKNHVSETIQQQDALPQASLVLQTEGLRREQS
jgi:hypothetical protein